MGGSKGKHYTSSDGAELEERQEDHSQGTESSCKGISGVLERHDTAFLHET